MTAPSGDSATVEWVPQLDAVSRDEVLSLLDEVTRADGVAPVSEHVVLRLHHPHEGDSQLLWRRDGVLAGYAHLDTSGPVPATEFAVHPRHRRCGGGTVLTQALLARCGGALQVWAHAHHPGAAALALRTGSIPVRRLRQMRRSLLDPLPPVRVPSGVRVRTFVPGQDEQDWLRVNRRAFATHPEQGRWTAEDLAMRMQEPWFDPAGFFLAERENSDGARLVGFHWTKIHDPADDGAAQGERIGEVYVVGVDPGEQGRGLGSALTLTGLHHLCDQGLREVLLYVDESNAAAVAVYERLGFTTFQVDVLYRIERAEDDSLARAV